jgi:hypothetical protein
LVLTAPCFGLSGDASYPGTLDISTASGTGALAPELLHHPGMLKRLGLRVLDLIDSVPLGWLLPRRQPVPLRVRRPRHPFAR